jgi:hypothetical protein
MLQFIIMWEVYLNKPTRTPLPFVKFMRCMLLHLSPFRPDYVQYKKERTDEPMYIFPIYFSIHHMHMAFLHYTPPS